VKEILNAIEAFAKWLGVDPTAVIVLLLLPLALAYGRYRYYQDVLKTGGGLAGVRERLAAHGGWRAAYFTHLHRALAWVDKGLGPSPWSAESYDFTLILALIYPFASLSLVCLVTGQNTSGISALLPEDLPSWRRALAAIALCAEAFFAYRVVTSSGSRKSAYFLAFLIATNGAIAVAGTVVLAFVFSLAFGGVGAVAGAGAVAFAFAVALAIAGVVAFALAIVGPSASVVVRWHSNTRWLCSFRWRCPTSPEFYD
jgi:hypothetical protein